MIVLFKIWIQGGEIFRFFFFEFSGVQSAWIVAETTKYLSKIHLQQESRIIQYTHLDELHSHKFEKQTSFLSLYP